MEKKDQKKTQTKANQSYLGLFMVLTLILTIPVTVLFLQQRQDIRERAAEPTQPLVAPETKTTTSRTFSGYVYYDDNQDGIRQPGERPYPNVSVQLIEKRDSTDINETNKQTIQTDANGYFTFHVPNQLPELTYAVLVVLPNGYKTINTNPTIFSQSNGEAREVAEFGLFPLSIPR